MHPVLIDFGRFQIYTYGFLIAVGFLTGVLVAKAEARRTGQDPEKIPDISFYLLISAIIGSRLFYVATTPKIFIENPIEIFKIWSGGLVFYGGFIGALIMVLIYVKKHDLSFWKIADVFTPSLALGHFFGRMGCFFAGCCYGKTCDLPWSVTFTDTASLAPIGIPLHPTQLYSAFSNLGIFLFLWFFRKKTRFDGQLFWIYILIYGVIRSFIEMFRGDFRGAFVLDIFSIAQVIGLVMAATAVWMLIFLGKRHQNTKVRHRRAKT
jgi:phosphatidylglycerol:prolipoprotein diacylglycerol transferase